ncbi:hypothetical protein ACHAXT_003868 [Thalassiosira profunda]
MTEVSLDRNGLGSESEEDTSRMVLLIALCLSQNHIVQSLDLEGNQLTDGLNIYLDADSNKKKKLLTYLPTMATDSGPPFGAMRNIGDIPICVVPHYMVFVQGLESRFTLGGMDINSLDTIFRFLRQWNMPLLFTSTAETYPRRSNRIRAKKVSQLMGK